mmetsp:Transcript_27296/g.91324  ORF Transcript_27296/g.91324 Transcript_27296/m.91324 type:complete len:231 (+) Transcript_27296:557-1249(+)
MGRYARLSLRRARPGPDVRAGRPAPSTVPREPATLGVRLGALPLGPHLPVSTLEDEPGEVGLGDHVPHVLVHVGRVHHDGLARAVARVEGDLLRHPLEDSVYPPRADVLHVAVDRGGQVGHAAQRAVREGEPHRLRLQEGHLLLDEARLGLREDAVQVVLRELRELHADGQPSLELREEVRGLALVEGPRADEEDVVRGNVAVLGGHSGALDEREQVPLHALGGGVRRAP